MGRNSEHFEKKAKNVLPKLKVWILSGKTISDAQAREKFRTNRLSEYIRRLRHDHRIKIKMTMTTAPNGDRYGVYSLEVKQKVDRIKTREYLNVL